MGLRMKYIIDTSSWIEYFNGTESGKKVFEIIENEENEILTSVITITELMFFFNKRKIHFEDSKNKILSISKIIPIDLILAEQTGVIYSKIKPLRPKLSLADCIILTTAIIFTAKIITKDQDFQGLKEAILIN
jgi:predicted nucleic acid-binding protein